MKSIADLPHPRAWWGTPALTRALWELHRARRDCPGLPAALRDSEFLRGCVVDTLRHDYVLEGHQAERVVWEFLRMTSLDG